MSESRVMVKGNDTVSKVGVKAFGDYLANHSQALASVAANFMDVKRLTKIVIANVSRTPKLQNCTIQSIFRTTMESAELGLELGSSLGESYAVPYRDQCQLIIGYRGLTTLAYRSGFVTNIAAREVYEGDEFEIEFGLEPKLRHVPSEETDPNKIKWAYCVVKLKDGGLLYDVMTRAQIDRIRARSKSSDSGPWVTDYAEMAKKTVLRRTLKYCPMSTQLSKAMAIDNSTETGDTDGLSELDTADVIDVEPIQEAPRKTGIDAIKSQLGVPTEAKNDDLVSKSTLTKITNLSKSLKYTDDQLLLSVNTMIAPEAVIETSLLTEDQALAVLAELEKEAAKC